MARREAYEITCDRCGRTETVPKDQCAPAPAPNEKGAFFSARIWVPGKGLCTISYDDVCRRCREAVKNYYDKITNVSIKEDQEVAEAEAKVETVDVPVSSPASEPNDNKMTGLRDKIFGGRAVHR